MTFHHLHPQGGPGGRPLKEIGGRYLLLEAIDRGRCAEVHLAVDRRENRPVAAKLGFGGGDNEFIRTVFRNETRALELGAHRNVVKLIDADPAGREPFIIMEYVPGPTLRALARDGSIDRRAALRMIGGMLEALAAIHANGLVHRDLKPKNIMLGSDRDVKIIDFGFASVPGIPDFTSRSDRRFGNPIYSPPEMINGVGDPRADIYSVGMMMYEMLGRRCSAPILDIARMLCTHRVPALIAAEAALGRLDEGAAGIIEKAISRDPSGRFQSALEMRERVERLLAGMPA